MADQIEPDMQEGPAKSETAVARKDAQAANLETPQPMLEVHPPHEPIHTWKGFLIHIVAIAIGLLLALALEQTVEAVHHAHQREEIEEQIRSVLNADLKINAGNFSKFVELRAYLSELRAAIAARLNGAQSPTQPPVRDSRAATFILFPGLAPYEAAQQNGTVALLTEHRIRLYNRLSFARGLMLFDRDRWFEQSNQLEAFQKRYVDSSGTMELNAITEAPDIRTLSKPQLEEYLQLVAALIERTDELRGRMDLVDQEMRSLLVGAETEAILLDDSIKARPHGFGVDMGTPSSP
jgi:hypothetical protein